MTSWLFSDMARQVLVHVVNGRTNVSSYSHLRFKSSHLGLVSETETSHLTLISDSNRLTLVLSPRHKYLILLSSQIQIVSLWSCLRDTYVSSSSHLTHTNLSSLGAIKGCGL